MPSKVRYRVHGQVGGRVRKLVRTRLSRRLWDRVLDLALAPTGHVRLRVIHNIPHMLENREDRSGETD